MTEDDICDPGAGPMGVQSEPLQVSQVKELAAPKTTDLAKVARREGQQFDRATRLHKAKQMPRRNSNVKSKDI